MIGKLRGRVDSTTEDSAIIDVNGVGYVVFCSGKTLAALPPEGEVVSLYIETHVREDHIHLYGFLTPEEQRWFNLLTTVQGVGNRVGMALLSACSIDEIATAIAAQDKTPLTKADGVGPKLATRIVTELKDKAPKLAAGPLAISARLSKPGTPANSNGAYDDAVSALVNLGYGRSEAFAAVSRVRAEEPDIADVARIIPRALKELAHA